MISQMDKNWVFGILYAKPHTAGANRYLQADKMAEAHCTSTSDGIDLCNIWTGPGQYDWGFQNPDNCGLTYDEVANVSIAKGFEVFGSIVTTPWWAMPSDGIESLLIQDAPAGQNYVKVASTAGFLAGKHVRVQDSNNVEAQEIASIPDGQTIVFTATLAHSYSVAAVAKCQQLVGEPSAPDKDQRHLWPPDGQFAAAFISACQQVAPHFLGRIRYWSYWNEPNGPGWHSYDPAEYTTWLIRCSQSIKAGNPNALVSIGGLWPVRSAPGAPAGDRAIPFIEAVRANGGQNYYDAIALHPYGPPFFKGDPFDIESVEAAWQNMVANGDSAKSIWCNEYGWQIVAGQGGDYVPDETTQAARVQQALGWLRFNHDYITMAGYHTLSDIPPNLQFGLCDGDLVPRQSFYRFKEMAPLLVVRPALKRPP